MLSQAVVLVGGLGTRLGALTADTPKPMLPIGDEPFLDILLRNLVRHGFNDILLLARHNVSKVRDHYETHSIEGVSIQVLEESHPAGTGGALREAAPFLQDVFLLTNGDSLFDFNYLALYEVFLSTQSMVALSLCEVPDISRYGQVTLDELGNVLSYAEKNGVLGESGLISGGVYIVSKKILEMIPSGQISLETDVMPGLVQKHAVSGAVFEGYFLDIGLPESYEQGQRELPEWENRKAVFFDRDGTLNQDNGYTHRIEDLVFLPDVPQMIRRCNDAGRLVIVLTNQAGIARGFYTEKEMHLFHAEMNRQLQKFGAHIDAFYFCPHHPDGVVPELSVKCACRKPGTAMFEEACRDWSIDLGGSILVGDRETDLAAAEAYSIEAYRTDGTNLASIIRSVEL